MIRIRFVVINTVQVCLPQGAAVACTVLAKIHPSPVDSSLKLEVSQQLEDCYP